MFCSGEIVEFINSIRNFRSSSALLGLRWWFGSASPGELQMANYPRFMILTTRGNSAIFFIVDFLVRFCDSEIPELPGLLTLPFSSPSLVFSFLPSLNSVDFAHVSPFHVLFMFCNKILTRCWRPPNSMLASASELGRPGCPSPFSSVWRVRETGKLNSKISRNTMRTPAFVEGIFNRVGRVAIADAKAYSCTARYCTFWVFGRKTFDFPYASLKVFPRFSFAPVTSSYSRPHAHVQCGDL